MDSLQAILLDRRAIPNEKAVLGAISGLSRAAAYSTMRVHDKTKLVQRLMPSQPAAFSKPAQARAVNQEPSQWLDQLWDFLYRADDPSRQMPMEDLAVDNGLDATRACALIDRATFMRDITIAPGGGFAFAMTTLSAPEKGVYFVHASRICVSITTWHGASRPLCTAYFRTIKTS